MIRRGRATYRLEEAFGSRPFTLAEARKVDVGKNTVSCLYQRGDLSRVVAGCYRLTHQPDSRTTHLDALDLLLARHADLALAGVSAAAAWDLPCPHIWGDWQALPRTVYSEKRIASRANLVRLSRTRRTVVVQDDRRVTDLLDTALDTAGQLPLPEALIVMDAIARRVAGSEDRRALLSEQARTKARTDLAERLAHRPKQPGLRRIRAAGKLVDPAAESPPESFIRGHLLAAALPAPVVNAAVRGRSGRQYYVDLFWPAVGRGLEIDGASKYVEPGVLLREKERQEDIEATGVRLMRRMAADVYRHPDAVVQAVRGAVFG